MRQACPPDSRTSWIYSYVMAQQESMIKLKGRVGDLTFYENNKGYQARSARGVDSARVKKDPSFVRSRENANEFGRAVQAAKLLRGVLRPLLLYNTDGTMVNRLNSRMVRVLKSDGSNSRGERMVHPENTGMLRLFDFNHTAPLHETLLVRYGMEADLSTSTVQLHLPAYFPKQAVVAPKEATHFRLTAAAVEIDFTGMGERGYPPLAMQTTALLPLTGQIPASSLVLAMDGRVDSGSVIVILGLSFFEQFGGELYPLKSKDASPLGIVEVLA